MSIKANGALRASEATPWGFGFSKGGLKAQWSTEPRASEATPWVSRVGAVAP